LRIITSCVIKITSKYIIIVLSYIVWWGQGTWYDIGRSEGIPGDHIMWGSRTGSTPALPYGLRLMEEHVRTLGSAPETLEASGCKPGIHE
jgi:hypothetical protein